MSALLDPVSEAALVGAPGPEVTKQWQRAVGLASHWTKQKARTDPNTR